MSALGVQPICVPGPDLRSVAAGGRPMDASACAAAAGRSSRWASSAPDGRLVLPR